jgi:hypothetical protein
MDVNRDDISETRYNLRLPAARAERENAGGGTIATLSAYFQQRCVRGRANRRLFTAVDTGYLVGLRAALRRGADINVTDFGWTPLNWAVHLMTLERGKGCPDVIIELLAAGADPNAGHEDGSGLRIAAYGGRKDVVLMLLRAGAQVSDAFRGKTRGTKVKAWRGLARSWFDQYDRGGNMDARTYLHDVAHAGGFVAYKDVRYRECVAAHLVARERRLPAEILDVTLNFLLSRGSTNLIILKKNTLSQISRERTFFRTKRNMRLALIFRCYEDISGLTCAGIKMCYRLPGSDVWLDRKGTVREAGLDLAEKSDDFARSFAPRILIEAHDASGVNIFRRVVS